MKLPLPSLEKESQMKSIINKNKIDVAVVKDKAYWVRNNKIYKSSIKENGDVDIENAEEVDVFSLSDKEMQALLKIVDSLN